MKIIDSILSYIKLIYGSLCVFKTSILCGIDPKNELKYRKKCAKILTNLIAKEIIIQGQYDKTADMYIGNHTHSLDIALMEYIIPEKLISIAKKELGEIPVIKYMVTKTDMILVDRTDKRSIIKTINQVKDRVKRGMKIMVYPEATRNKINPKKMIQWKKGVKAIAEKLNLKVQPFVIVNLPFAFKNKPFRVEKQIIKVVFLESFYPKDNPNWYEETKEKMQKVLDEEYAKINKGD